MFTKDECISYADDIVRCLEKIGITNFSHYEVRGSQIRFFFTINEKDKCYVIDGELYKNYLNAFPYEVANYLSYYVKNNIDLKWGI